MLLNYHELTATESKDSPARKKQFLVICSVMIFFIVHSLFTTGVLQPLDVQQSTFPGGEFVYKYASRDYAASPSLLNTVAEDLKVKQKEYEDVMYNLYLDDPWAVTGRGQRFASGILLNSSTKTKHQETNEERKLLLLEQRNKEIQDSAPKDVGDLPLHKLWETLTYNSHELPQVKAAVVQFPFTNGFVSALVHSYKVFPAIRKYAKEHGAPGVPVVLTTCSIKESMCTHFVPLAELEAFRLGQPDGDEYAKTLENNVSVDWDGVRKMFWKVITFGQGADEDAAPKEETKKPAEPVVESKEEL